VNTFTRLLLKTRISPNQISVISIVFGISGAAFFLHSFHHPLALLGAAASIQLRLIANMMDGLVATEGGRASANGLLYNEVPDRFTDVLFLASAGYASGSSVGIIAGWLASCGALMTAYIRLHGAAINEGAHDFCGPFAKPQRMFVLTLAALIAAFFPTFGILTGSLVLIAAGTFFTFARRTARLSKQLKARA